MGTAPDKKATDSVLTKSVVFSKYKHCSTCMSLVNFHGPEMVVFDNFVHITQFLVEIIHQPFHKSLLLEKSFY